MKSKTVVKDSQLDKDEITTLTAGVVQVAVMDEKWDGREYWLKAQVKADPDEVAASIDKLKNDEQLVHDLEEARAEAAQAMEEAEVLRQQLAQTTADKQKQEQYNETMNQLVASDYFEGAVRSPLPEITGPPRMHITRPSCSSLNTRKPISTEVSFIFSWEDMSRRQMISRWPLL